MCTNNKATHCHSWACSHLCIWAHVGACLGTLGVSDHWALPLTFLLLWSCLLWAVPNCQADQGISSSSAVHLHLRLLFFWMRHLSLGQLCAGLGIKFLLVAVAAWQGSYSGNWHRIVVTELGKHGSSGGNTSDSGLFQLFILNKCSLLDYCWVNFQPWNGCLDNLIQFYYHDFLPVQKSRSWQAGNYRPYWQGHNWCFVKTSVWLNRTPRLHDPHVSTETSSELPD